MDELKVLKTVLMGILLSHGVNAHDTGAYIEAIDIMCNKKEEKDNESN